MINFPSFIFSYNNSEWSTSANDYIIHSEVGCLYGQIHIDYPLYTNNCSLFYSLNKKL